MTLLTRLTEYAATRTFGLDEGGGAFANPARRIASNATLRHCDWDTKCLVS